MNIVCTGSIAYDYLMTFPGLFKEHILPEHLDKISLSFLVDSMVRVRGGVAPNIAYTLALLGGTPRLAATAGIDFEEYRAWLESKGVDTCAVKIIPGIYTASFFATTDQSNAQLASFYPGAMAYAAEISLTALPCGRPDLVIISPNDPGAMVAYADECRTAGIDYLYDPGQNIIRMDGGALRRGVEGALSLFVNEYEYELLQRRTGLKPEELISRLKFMVVTCGERGAQIFVDGTVYQIPVVPPDEILDPTGVGDAFRGGFLTAYSRGWDWDICGKMGSLAATYCLEKKGTQAHAYTLAEFTGRFRRHFDDRGVLDGLIQQL